MNRDNIKESLRTVKELNKTVNTLDYLDKEGTRFDISVKYLFDKLVFSIDKEMDIDNDIYRQKVNELEHELRLKIRELLEFKTNMLENKLKLLTND